MSTVRPLERQEMDALLARNRVGRIAYTFHDDVDIEPLDYVYADGVVYTRTSPGHTLDALAHHRWVAFEVDEVDGPFDWRSVVVHGGVYPVRPDDAGGHTGREAYHRALARLRELTPAAFRAGDPSPERTVLLRIHVDRMTGRSSAAA